MRTRRCLMVNVERLSARGRDKKYNCGMLRPAPRGTFFCSAKRKYPKKRPPPMAQTASALLGFGALAERQHFRVLSLGSGPPVRSPDGLHPKPCDAQSRAIGGSNSKTRLSSTHAAVIASTAKQSRNAVLSRFEIAEPVPSLPRDRFAPRSDGRLGRSPEGSGELGSRFSPPRAAPSTAGEPAGWRARMFEPERRASAAGEFRARAGLPRSAGHRRDESSRRRRDGGRLSFGDFSLAKQRKVTLVAGRSTPQLPISYIDQSREARPTTFTSSPHHCANPGSIQQ